MATWKKVVVSGSSISALNNDANFLVEGQSGAALTGSFTGSFTGDGSGLTGVVASNANPLTQGNAITTFSYDGSTSGVTVGVNASDLVGAGLGHTGGNTLKVVPEDTTIAVSAGGIKVVEANLSGIPTTSLTANSIQIGTTDIELGATGSSVAGLTLTGAVVTGSFSGSFVGTTNLPDLISGNGISGGPYDGAATATFAVQPDGSTLTVGAGGVKVSDAGITATQIATSVAGAGLSGGAGTALAVNVDDSSIEIATDTLRVKEGGVTNAMLDTDGETTLGSTVLTLGSTAASLAGLTTVSATSFTGSFNGDGSDLTGLVSTLALSGSTGTGVVNLKTQALTIEAGEGIDTVASGQTITISGEDATTTNKGIASFNSGDFAVSSGAVSLASDITIDNDLTVTRDMLVSRNAVVSGNLTVAGTASFQNTQNLDVADRFIRMASGSTAVGDGGIVVQQTGPANGEAFAYDAATTRWSMTGSFDPSTEAYTPDAFVSAIVEGGVGVNTPAAVVAKYNKKGNIFVGANEDIYIYS